MPYHPPPRNGSQFIVNVAEGGFLLIADNMGRRTASFQRMTPEHLANCARVLIRDTEDIHWGRNPIIFTPDFGMDRGIQKHYECAYTKIPLKEILIQAGITHGRV